MCPGHIGVCTGKRREATMALNIAYGERDVLLHWLEGIKKNPSANKMYSR